MTSYLLLTAVTTLCCAGTMGQLQAQATAQLAPDSTVTMPPAPPVRASLVGSVVDELNNPMAGVTVKLVGGNIQDLSITNSVGRFLLEVPTTGGSVTLTFQGYYTQELTFTKIREIHVVLQPLPGFKRERKQRVIYRRHNKALIAYPNQ